MFVQHFSAQKVKRSLNFIEFSLLGVVFFFPLLLLLSSLLAVNLQLKLHIDRPPHPLPITPH